MSSEAASVTPKVRPDLLFRELTERVIGAAYEVHSQLGAGFLEKVYERALCVELQKRGLPYRVQAEMEVLYKTVPVGIFVADLVVENKVICEVKAVNRIVSGHEAQLINYLKATGRNVGLLFNFGGSSLTFRRLVFQNPRQSA